MYRLNSVCRLKSGAPFSISKKWGGGWSGPFVPFPKITPTVNYYANK